MVMDFKKRHQRFVNELRKAVLQDATKAKSKLKAVSCDIICDSDEARIQAELQAKYEELFGASDESS